MKLYLFLLFFGVSAYGAAIEPSESHASIHSAAVEPSEISGDFSEYYNAATIEYDTDKSRNEAAPLVAPKNATADALLLEKLKDIHAGTRMGLPLVCDTYHEQCILKCMGSSKGAFKKLAALTTLAEKREWPAVEKRVIAKLLDEHPRAHKKVNLKPKKSGLLSILRYKRTA